MKKSLFVAVAIATFSVANFGAFVSNNFAHEILSEVSAAQNTDPKFSFQGICFGMTLNEVKSILGEPVGQADNDEFIFSNGLIIEFSDYDNTIKEIETLKNGMATDAGVAVGMYASKLSELYGSADVVKTEDGKTEYKYFGGNGRFVIEFAVRGNVIEKIESKIRD